MAGELHHRLADLVHTVARGAASLEVVCARARELLECASASVALVDDGDLVMRAVADGTRVQLVSGRPSALVASAFGKRRMATSADGADVAIPLCGEDGRVVGVLVCTGVDATRDPEAWAARSEVVAAAVAGVVVHPQVLDAVADQSRDVDALLRRMGAAAASATPGSSEAADAIATLLGLAQDVASAGDPSTMLDRLVGRGAALAKAELALVVSWRLHEGRYRAEAASGISIDRLQTIVGPDMYTREGERLCLVPAWVAHLEAAAGLPDALVEWTVPIRFCGSTLGAFTILTTNAGCPTPAQRAIVEWLAHQAGAAVMSARVDEDLQTAARLKADFIATMSHELRTPLNVVMGYADLLEEEAFGSLTPEQHGILAKVQGGQRELYRLVIAMLDLNRLQAGASPSTLEPVDMARLFATVAADRGVVPAAPSVAVDWDAGDPALVIETDRKKLLAVIENLVGNAIKFTPAGRVDVTAAVDGDQVVITVADTGIGIRREDVEVIFDMFRQLETANTRRHGGVGLGLYIVRRVVADLGGSIAVTSEPGVGSQFVVRLPLAPANGTSRR